MRENIYIGFQFGFRKQNEKGFLVVSTEGLLHIYLRFLNLFCWALNPRMVCSKKMICGRRVHRFSVSLIVCMVLISSQSRLYNAEGRKLAQIADNSETVNEEKAILRAKIGSRPPRCERRCVSCAHCVAIQLPTNPQTRNRINNVSAAAYVRGDDTSNYKPMSWKCKCGSLIFNP